MKIRILRRCAVTMGIALASSAAASGSGHMEMAALPDDLTELSLEDLMAVEVISVSKKAEPLQVAAGAIFVVTGDDIRRTGARSIAEALRLVPGLHVARDASASYAISARGFNKTSADKMEVLLDGRSVYTPLFSGVFWDALDTYLPDIDRIEVIRGPGATLWGANAVNGVINIVTRHSDAEPGTQVLLEAGTELRAHGAVRATGRIGDSGTARFYAKGFELDNTRRADGADSVDGQAQVQAGFRMDIDSSERSTMMFTGDIYDSRIYSEDVFTQAPADDEHSGANLNLRWRLALSDDNQVELRTYYDHSKRFIPALFSERRDTWNLDLQQRISSGRHEWIYGAGYRRSDDETGGEPLLVVFSPQDRTLETFNAFVQDKISFFDGRLKWTLGSKFEHNDFTGFEVQPGTRLGWEINERWFSWTALSRAVRTPNRLDHDIAIFCAPPNGIPGVCGPGLFPLGSPGFDSEKLTALEWGLRFTDQAHWSTDLSLFYNRYEDVKTNESSPPPFGSTDNRAKATSVGGELSVNWRPAPALDVRASYSYLGLDIETDADSTDPDGNAEEDTDPRHQASLRLNWQLSSRTDLGAFLRHVGRLKTTQVPDYTELNLRLAYRMSNSLELALVGENLLDASHAEFGADAADRAEIERSARLQLRWSLD